MKKVKRAYGSKMLLVVGIVGNLMVLVYFKYWNFIIANMNQLLEHNYALLDVIWPVGISFFTFSQISFFSRFL
ncbi:MAG: hypothetical protein R3Y54_11525 [Eubacteriales bacterium]